jgi:hypothetical protein
MISSKILFGAVVINLITSASSAVNTKKADHSFKKGKYNSSQKKIPVIAAEKKRSFISLFIYAEFSVINILLKLTLKQAISLLKV